MSVPTALPALPPDVGETEEPLFSVGDLLELKPDCDFLEPFTGILLQNVMPDGESMLCEMLVTSRSDGKAWIGRVWQGYMRLISSGCPDTSSHPP